MKDKRKNVSRCESWSEWFQNNRLDKLGRYPTLSHGTSSFPQKCWSLFRIDTLEIIWLFSSQCTFVSCNSNKSIHLCTYTWYFLMFFLTSFFMWIIHSINTHATIHGYLDSLWVQYSLHFLYSTFGFADAEKIYRSMHSKNLFHMDSLIFCLSNL